jgi:hypothetical protein
MIPQGAPGALPEGTPGPADAVSVQRMNEIYLDGRQSVANRLEADGRGFAGVFAQ